MKTLCRFALIASIMIAVYGVAMLGLRHPWPVIIGLIITAIIAAKKGYIQLTAFGTARWADADDLRRAGMLDADSGLILGRVTDSGRRAWPVMKALFNPRVASDVAVEQFLALFRKHPPQALVRLSKAVHTAVFAPTGVGKGVSCVIPYLQTCPDSCVVIDFKGENAKLTAEHRREKFGHKVIILDPFKVVTQTPDSFNPLDCIDKTNPLAIDDCGTLAESLVIRTGQEKDPHWPDSAEMWIGAMLAVVAQYGEPGDRSLQTVRTLLSNPAKMDAVVKLMCSSDAWQGMLARKGSQLTRYLDKELASTLTTVNRFMRFLDTIAVAESTKKSSFDPAELRKGKMTVYLVLPPEHMRTQAPLLRMWISSMLRAVVRGGLQEKTKVHFVLDEAKSLGHLESLDDAVDKFRGYGVRLIYMWQSMGQLKLCFPEGQDQTFLSNVSQVFFGVQDQQTAEYVSARLGEETIVVGSGGTSTGMSRQESNGTAPGSTTYSRNENSNWSQQARKLLKPEEVAALPQDVAITFTPGVPPICTRLIKYYNEPALLGELPGFFQRAWKQLRMIAECVTLLVTAILVTAVLTGLLK